jgi:predicted dehydrogenase
VIGQMMVSFDVWDSETPRLEIYGTEGTLCVPDPDPGDGANVFEGPIWIRTRETARWTMRPRPKAPKDWSEVPNTHGLNFDARGVGVAEMMDAVHSDRPPRASGSLGLHLCEVMQAMLDSPKLGRFVDIKSSPARPPMLPETSGAGFNIDLGAPA